MLADLEAQLSLESQTQSGLKFSLTFPKVSGINVSPGFGTAKQVMQDLNRQENDGDDDENSATRHQRDGQENAVGERRDCLQSGYCHTTEATGCRRWQCQAAAERLEMEQSKHDFGSEGLSGKGGTREEGLRSGPRDESQGGQIGWKFGLGK